MRHEQFRAFLTDQGLAAEQASAAARIEERLGFNLDNADLGALGVAALAKRLQAETAPLAGIDVPSALQAYSQFLSHYKAR
jgi:hypothetical protein